MKEYKQIIEGYYDERKQVKAIDLLSNKPIVLDKRPDMKQRVERAINFQQYLAPLLNLHLPIKNHHF